MESVRIAPLDPPYEQEIVAQLMKWMPPAAAVEPLKLFRTLALHQDLFARMRPLGAGVLGSRVVDPDLREVMIHRTCARCGAEYEWGGSVSEDAEIVASSPARVLRITAHR